MKQCFIESVLPAAGQVLETMFFTGVVAVEEQAEGACDGRISKTVQFEGPSSGEFCVGLPGETAAALASSFLGLPLEEITVAQCEQIAAELANMICGSVVSRYSPQGSFRLRAVPTSSCKSECDFCVSLELPEGGLSICARLS
jgi:hypothetical protein